MEKTSRMYVLDLVEAIINQIQLASHCQELLHYYYTEYRKSQDQLYIGMMDIQQDILEKSIKMRRDMMEKLKTENSDHNSWCSMKHAMATYGFMLEVHYANPEDLQFKYLAQQAYEHMVTILSIFLGVPEIVTCGRCLCDQLIEKDAG